MRDLSCINHTLERPELRSGFKSPPAGITGFSLIGSTIRNRGYPGSGVAQQQGPVLRMVYGMDLRIFRLARAGGIDTNPTTFTQRAGTFKEGL